MLQFNPQKRITAEDALKHPYFQSLYDPGDIKTASKFDFKQFERDAEKHGIKPVMYNTILEFVEREKRKKEALKQQK